MKRLGLVLALLLCAEYVHAQLMLIRTHTFHAATGSPANGIPMAVDQYNSLGLQVTITNTATVTFEATQDGTTWTAFGCTLASDTSGAKVATAAASGAYHCNIGTYQQFRARVSAWTSGTVTVTGRASTAVVGLGGGGGGGGGSGTVTSVSASGGVETASGSAITGSGTIRGNVCVNVQDGGGSYTVLDTDRACVVALGETYAELPEAGSAGFDSGYYVSFKNIGTDPAEISADTSTIDGGPEVTLAPNETIRLISDGANYITAFRSGLSSAPPSLADVAAVGRVVGDAVSPETAVKIGSTADDELWGTWRDSTHGPRATCIRASDNVPDLCNKYALVKPTYKWGVTDENGDTLLNFDPNASEPHDQYALGDKKIGKYLFFPADYFIGDGTNCPQRASVATINGGPRTSTMICGSGANGDMDVDIVMPIKWDGGVLYFEPVYTQTAANTSAMNSDIKAQCRGTGETPSGTWGTSVPIDDAAVTGSSATDKMWSAAVTPAGTCNGGEQLFVRYTLDVTGTTTPEATLHFYGLGMYWYEDSLSD